LTGACADRGKALALKGVSTCSGMSGLLRLKTPDVWEQVGIGPAPAGSNGTVQLCGERYSKGSASVPCQEG
jgi:hypothetical protein